MKAILILDDMPPNCARCPMCDGEWFACNYLGTRCEYKRRRKDCPLKPMPKKVLTPYYDMGYGRVSSAQEALNLGWNLCIEEIQK